MLTSNWAQAKIPVDIISKTQRSLGKLLVAKSSIKDEEKLKGLAIKLVKEKTPLTSVEMTAELVYINNPTESIKELERIVVNTGLGEWCGGCLKLKEEIKSIKNELEEKINKLENEIKMTKELNILMVVVGELVGITYRILFDIAIEKYHMPKKIKNKIGKFVLVDIPLFLNLSQKKGGFLREYLEKALKEKDITTNEYDTLVTAKRTRNDQFHSYEPGEALDTLELSTVHDPIFEKAKEVLLKHRTLFATEDEYSFIDDSM
jgi:thiol-disulfide isomerase/thioredoxin